jgi:hypothetical protein
MAEETREPRPGDVIWADRSVKGRPYNHCGIYEGGGYVVHYAAPEGSEINQENAVVHRTTLEAFKDGCPFKIIDFPEGYSREETLRRARSRMGERDYNFALNNCDHFATWCRTGEHRSLQADAVKNTIRALSPVVGGSAAELVCTIHDIAESFKAPKLDAIDERQKPKEILDTLDFNSDITDFVPPVPLESPVEEIPIPYEQDELTEFSEEPVEEALEDDTPSGKKPLYERIADKLKGWTFPIAGALEILKRLKKLPPIMLNIDYNTLGAKVRNGIDNVVSIIKVIAGKITPAQAKEEMRKNQTALLGQTAAQEQKLPVREAVKQSFGKIGTAVKHIAQQAVSIFVPQPVRTAIKTGFQKVGHAAVSGIKTAAKNTGTFLRTAGRTVLSFLGRK